MKFSILRTFLSFLLPFGIVVTTAAATDVGSSSLTRMRHREDGNNNKDVVPFGPVSKQHHGGEEEKGELDFVFPRELVGDMSMSMPPPPSTPPPSTSPSTPPPSTAQYVLGSYLLEKHGDDKDPSSDKVIAFVVLNVDISCDKDGNTKRSFRIFPQSFRSGIMNDDGLVNYWIGLLHVHRGIHWHFSRQMTFTCVKKDEENENDDEYIVTTFERSPVSDYLNPDGNPDLYTHYTPLTIAAAPPSLQAAADAVDEDNHINDKENTGFVVISSAAPPVVVGGGVSAGGTMLLFGLAVSAFLM